MSPRLETSSATQTEALAAELAARLAPGDVVLVEGELGAGKTTFVRGACRALGVESVVTSPTFTIGQRYRGRVPVSHLDLYRLRDGGVDGDDLVLLEDELGPDRVAFVEWPAALSAEQLGREPTARVVLRHAGADERRVEVHVP